MDLIFHGPLGMELSLNKSTGVARVKAAEKESPAQLVVGRALTAIEGVPVGEIRDKKSWLAVVAKPRAGAAAALTFEAPAVSPEEPVQPVQRARRSSTRSRRPPRPRRNRADAVRGRAGSAPAPARGRQAVNRAGVRFGPRPRVELGAHALARGSRGSRADGFFNRTPVTRAYFAAKDCKAKSRDARLISREPPSGTERPRASPRRRPAPRSRRAGPGRRRESSPPRRVATTRRRRAGRDRLRRAGRSLRRRPRQPPPRGAAGATRGRQAFKPGVRFGPPDAGAFPIGSAGPWPHGVRELMGSRTWRVSISAVVSAGGPALPSRWPRPSARDRLRRPSCRGSDADASAIVAAASGGARAQFSLLARSRPCRRSRRH